MRGHAGCIGTVRSGRHGGRNRLRPTARHGRAGCRPGRRSEGHRHLGAMLGPGSGECRTGETGKLRGRRRVRDRQRQFRRDRPRCSGDPDPPPSPPLGLPLVIWLSSGISSPPPHWGQTPRLPARNAFTFSLFPHVGQRNRIPITSAAAALLLNAIGPWRLIIHGAKLLGRLRLHPVLDEA